MEMADLFQYKVCVVLPPDQSHATALPAQPITMNQLHQPTNGQITNAVNVNRNQSALVPFLHTEFNGVKASVYNKVPSPPLTP